MLHHRAYLAIALALTTGVGLSGCAGYQVGSQSLFRSDVRTVHVPVFRSESYRRGLGEQLTEAVVKELRGRSHFIVVNDISADSVLSGRIVSVRKRVLSENTNDEPRNLELDMQVEVTWTDRFGQVLFQRAFLLVSHDANFIPEAGQSLGTAMQQTMQRTARQIVNEMEAPW